MEGHLTVGYADGGDRPDKEIEVLPGAVDDADRFLTDETATLERIGQVSRLVDGFETPYGLELLATVHWVVTRGGATTTEAATVAVHEWAERKRQFTPRQIGIAFDQLRAEGWLGSESSTQASA